ncbi:hypothetical protein Taro_016299, partial [Colocasia esculenta]|nr:hypothetical protein [Colocasia esculenta]
MAKSTDSERNRPMATRLGGGHPPTYGTGWNRGWIDRNQGSGVTRAPPSQSQRRRSSPSPLLPSELRGGSPPAIAANAASFFLSLSVLFSLFLQ